MAVVLAELRDCVVFVQRGSVVVATLVAGGTVEGHGPTEHQAVLALAERSAWLLEQAKAGVMPTHGASTVN